MTAGVGVAPCLTKPMFTPGNGIGEIKAYGSVSAPQCDFGGIRESHVAKVDCYCLHVYAVHSASDVQAVDLDEIVRVQVDVVRVGINASITNAKGVAVLCGGRTNMELFQ